MGHFSTPLMEVDSEIFRLLELEGQHLASRISLGASENYVSRAQLQAMSSMVGHVTFEGYIDDRLLSCSENVDALENIAIKRACKLFGSEFANVQPHSGTQANQAAILSLAKIGSTTLSMASEEGGHFSHGGERSLAGAIFKNEFFGVDPITGYINYSDVLQIAQKTSPSVIIVGGSTYPRVIDFKKFREIADTVNAKLIVDIAHMSGLIAAGLYPSPLPYADIVTMTSYKNFRGPKGGLLLTNKEDIAEAVNQSLVPCIQGTPIFNMMLGKAVALKEAMAPAFTVYQKEILSNIRHLIKKTEQGGLELVTAGSDMPFLVIRLNKNFSTTKTIVEHLARLGFDVDAVPLPGLIRLGQEIQKWGIRVGVSAITSRGASGDLFDEIAELFCEALRAILVSVDDVGCVGIRETENIKRRVAVITKRLGFYSH